VQATGSITIMGVLSGTAHAGCSGNSNAQIFASTMEQPLLWINSTHVENQQIVHKRGYSVASLQKKSQANKYTMGDV
jgi:septum formation inhibitor MinC